MKKKKQIVVVLGMHRSGTSAITRGLKTLGVELGDNLIGAIPGDNDKGFWEDVDINTFNEGLLTRLASTWHDVKILDEATLLSKRLSSERKAAINLLQKKLSSTTDVFCFKDPRTAILLPFWNDIFKQLNLDVDYLLAVRNPVNVADSLGRRDGLAREVSFLLWAKHIIGAMRFTNKEKCLVVDYDCLLDSPTTQLERIADKFALPSPSEKGADLREYTEVFLEESLRHHKSDAAELAANPELPAFIGLAYTWLLKLAKDEIGFKDSALKKSWAKIENSFHEFAPVYTYIDHAENELNNNREKISLLTAARDTAAAEQKIAVALRDSSVAERDQALVDRGYAYSSRDAAAAERDAAVKERDAISANRDSVVDELNATIANRDSVIKDRDTAFSARDAAFAERDTAVAELDTAVAERDTALAERDTLNANRASLVSELAATIANRDSLSKELAATIANRNSILYQRNALLLQLQGARDELALVVNSKSWLLTQPIRSAKRIFFTIPYQHLRLYCSRLLRFSWHALPLSVERRLLIKGVIFRAFPWLFRRFKAYRDWQQFIGETPSPEFDPSLPGSSDTELNAATENQVANSPIAAIPAESVMTSAAVVATPPLLAKNVEPVPLLDKEQIENLPVKMIAFYLPQFHAIPENDEWWGEGFTEWTNVRPAVPQFNGHYQPHVPNELGYYDLRNTDVQARQIELAKLYGIGGFCFYFYWFADKRLLEDPLLNYLNNPQLDHPFCLCWANENWTRRWDGLDNDILIGQNYSEEDDLAFIEYVSRYLKDERYIRIQGKPLLLVYRPSLLPSAKQTAQRWRQWCRDNGVGEIYLAYTQSFETVNPLSYGFDAAVEFPPNNSAPPEVTDQIVPLRQDFAGNVYDWNVFVERSQNYSNPPYKLFRSVNPAWDNTARKKNRGAIFINSEPLGYQEWLCNAVKETLLQNDEPDEKLVFVNAWNEWAEGAHLEPDQKYGYAYLEASRMSMLRTNLLPQVSGLHDDIVQKNQTLPGLAVIVHAFYPDVFKLILDYVVQIDCDIKLFVTVPSKQAGDVRKLLKQSSVPSYVLEVDNHGRDILPFLKIIEQVKREGFEAFVKVHTKKSKHRIDGDVWREDLYNKLLSSRQVTSIMKYFNDNPEVGMIGPEGHIVPMTFYWGSNENRVLGLAARMGISHERVMEQPFVAGSMFYCRLSALSPFMNLAFREKDFETEQGQVDGTLAHAIERAFAISVVSAGMRLVSTNQVASDESSGCDVTEDYAFAERQM